jgi:glycosyltransferase involved in cell wall biosynthesis
MPARPAGPAPSVSVVLATYNYAQFLAESVGSVLDQTFEDLELIVVDDGSSDETVDVLKQFGNDRRVRCIRQAHRGPASAFNRGLAQARGRYVALQAADDAWLPKKLARQVAVLDREPHVGLVYTDTLVVDADGQLLRRHFENARFSPAVGWVLPQLLLSNFVPASSVLIRADALAQVGAHDERLEVCEDWDLWLRIAQHFTFAFVDEPLVRVRRHARNTHLHRLPMVRDSLFVLERFASAVEPSEALGRGLRARAFANAHTRAAVDLYAAGVPRTALGHLARAVGFDWRSVSRQQLKLAARCALASVGLDSAANRARGVRRP